jgi:hypothetical protein
MEHMPAWQNRELGMGKRPPANLAGSPDETTSSDAPLDL